MKVEVNLNVHARGFTISQVKKIISDVLRLERKKDYGVSVLLTGDKEIRKINKKYLRHDFATDVISFGVDEDTRVKGEVKFLGDIVVSVETAKKTAGRLGISFKEELARYLIHGTLHLLGYRDENEKAKAAMWRRQEFLLKKTAAA